MIRKHEPLLITMLLILTVSGGCRKRDTDIVRPQVLHVWTTESDRDTISVMEEIGREIVAEEKNIERVEILSVKWSELSVKLQQAYEAGALPGVTHLEPFFTKFFIEKGLLLPIDDIIKNIGEADIHPAVSKVAYFDGHYYGIPQHFGISFMAYRKDLLDEAGVLPPKTWEDMLQVAEELTNSEKGQFGIHLPGGDRFFVDAIFFEALASNGGKAYTSDGKPDFNNPRVIETLEYLQNLIKFAPRDWGNTTYVEGFPRMVRGQAAINLFVGGRATKTFDDQWNEVERGIPANQVFVPLAPPHGASGRVGFCSVDCEPFVVINQFKNRGTGKEAALIIETASKRYIELLYRKDNYLKLMKTVPIQLIPIFRSMLDDYANSPTVRRWRPWFDHAIEMVEQERVIPYFTTETRDLKIPWLFEVYGRKVITKMVSSVLTGQATPVEAARKAQQGALEIANGE